MFLLEAAHFGSRWFEIVRIYRFINIIKDYFRDFQNFITSMSCEGVPLAIPGTNLQ